MDDRPGLIEIDLPNGARVRVDAFVNRRALNRRAIGAGRI
jgi:transposase